jgi:hypothetical protein
MRLQYSITRFDLFRAGLRALMYQRILWLLVLPLMGITWWSGFNDPEHRNELVTVRIAAATFNAVTCAVVGILAGGAFLGLQTLFRRDKGVLGKHTLEITEEGVVESTDVNRSLANWGTDFRIRETSQYAYIYVSDTNAHVIPKTRSPLEGSVDEFLAELRARIRQFQQAASAKGGSATPLDRSAVTGRTPPVS